MAGVVSVKSVKSVIHAGSIVKGPKLSAAGVVKESLGTPVGSPSSGSVEGSLIRSLIGSVEVSESSKESERSSEPLNGSVVT